MRTILHIDLDAFYAAVEQRDNPALRGKPVIVGAPPDQRGVVSTCSYEARKFGVRSAMPSQEAHWRCPSGIFLPPDMARYAEASEQVFAIFARYTPLIEPVSVDEAFLDVSGSRKLFGDGSTIAAAIREAIRKEVGITASAGVAHNKFLAKLGGEEKKPDGLFVVPNDPEVIRAYLAPKPIGALWGVGKVLRETLNAKGYRIVGDLQKADPRHLASLLTPAGADALIELSFGRDERPVETESEEKSISREHTFLEDCDDREVLLDTLRDITLDVGRRLRKSGYYSRTARLKIRWDDFTTITRQCPFPSAVNDDFTLLETAHALFNKEKLIAPIRLIGFGVTNLGGEAHEEQLSLFDSPSADRKKREQLSNVIDEINEQYGRGTLSIAPRHLPQDDEAED